MVKTKWTTISLPSEMLNELDKFSKTDEGKKYGLTSKSQIIALLVRKFLDTGTDMLSESNSFKNNEIKKLTKDMDALKAKLERHELVLERQDIIDGNITFEGTEQDETNVLHGKDRIKLLNKIDSPNTSKKITVYLTSDKKKVLKDNHIKGLVTVEIFRKTLKCSYHNKDDSCIHIKYSLEKDIIFRRNAYIQNVKNPILEKYYPKQLY